MSSGLYAASLPCTPLGGGAMSCSWFEAIPAIREQVTRASHLLVCLDFDGTLTPYVEDPATASLGPPVQRVLRSLASHQHVSLAIISGRNRADVQARVGIPDLIYAGNHGLEINGPGCFFVEPTAVSYGQALPALAADLGCGEHAPVLPLRGPFRPEQRECSA